MPPAVGARRLLPAFLWLACGTGRAAAQLVIDCEAVALNRKDARRENMWCFEIPLDVSIVAHTPDNSPHATLPCCVLPMPRIHAEIPELTSDALAPPYTHTTVHRIATSILYSSIASSPSASSRQTAVAPRTGLPNVSRRRRRRRRIPRRRPHRLRCQSARPSRPSLPSRHRHHRPRRPRHRARRGRRSRPPRRQSRQRHRAPRANRRAPSCTRAAWS